MRNAVAVEVGEPSDNLSGQAPPTVAPGKDAAPAVGQLLAHQRLQVAAAHKLHAQEALAVCSKTGRGA